MGFNYGLEKKKFEMEWKKKAAWYRAEGMSEECIRQLYEDDWREFKASRVYRLHNQGLSEHIILELTENDNHSRYPGVHFLPLEEELSGRYDWIEQIDSPELAQKLCRLSIEDKELLTLFAIEGYTETYIASIFSCTQQNIAKKLARIKKSLR